MNLEEIVKAGKKDAQARALLNDFDNKDYINVFPAIAEIDGGKDVLGDVTPEKFAMLNRTEAYPFVEGLANKKKAELVMKVHEDYAGVIDALKSFEGLLLTVKPVEGINEDVEKKHKKAYRANEALKDPQRGVNSLLEDYSQSENIIAHAAIILIQNRNGVGEAVLSNRAGRAVSELRDALKDEKVAKDYVLRLYEKSDDKGKVDLAYSLGQSITAQELSKKK